MALNSSLLRLVNKGNSSFRLALNTRLNIRGCRTHHLKSRFLLNLKLSLNNSISRPLRSSQHRQTRTSQNLTAHLTFKAHLISTRQDPLQRIASSQMAMASNTILRMLTCTTSHNTLMPNRPRHSSSKTPTGSKHTNKST